MPRSPLCVPAVFHILIVYAILSNKNEIPDNVWLDITWTSLVSRDFDSVELINRDKYTNTFMAAFLMKDFAVSFQIAGTVSTQRISSFFVSVSPFSLSLCRRCSFMYFIAAENTSMAGIFFPLMSLSIDLLFMGSCWMNKCVSLRVKYHRLCL